MVSAQRLGALYKPLESLDWFAMEYCSIDDAFPDLTGDTPVGCRGGTSTSQQRRAERKKARRCKGPAGAYVESNNGVAAAPATDPDRPALIKTATPDAFQRGLPLNPSTGIAVHAPLTADPGTMEPFDGSGESREEELEEEDPAGTAARNRLPQLQRNATTGMSEPSAVEAAPAWFLGKAGGVDDEGFAPYTGSENDVKEFMLEPSFGAAFSGTGLERATGGALPRPSIRDSWKPMTASGVPTAFYSGSSSAGGLGGAVRGGNTQDEVMKRLDKIWARLDDLEAGRGGRGGGRSGSSNGSSNNVAADAATSQKEVLMFTMSGIFVMFLLDLVVRKAGRR